MDALFNAVDRQGGINPSDTAVAGRGVNFGPTDSTPGVSVENASAASLPDGPAAPGPSPALDLADYIQLPDHRWYVLRASYARAQRAADVLRQEGQIAVYLPQHYVTRRGADGLKHRQVELLLPSLLFAYATPAEAARYAGPTSPLPYLTYYYNHFQVDSYGKNPPLVVPFDEMQNFIRATRLVDDVLLVDPATIRYKSGDWVQITDGPFEGVRGRVARIGRQQRVVVSLYDLCCVATAYIPTAFLRRVDRPVRS